MKTYIGRFASNYDSTFEVVVLKRTEKSVTFIHPQTKEKKRAKIHNHNGEFFMPFGNHSMSPVIQLNSNWWDQIVTDRNAERRLGKLNETQGKNDDYI